MTKEQNISPIDQKSVRIVLVPQKNGSSSYTSLKLRGPVGDEEREYLIEHPSNELYSINKTNFKDSYNPKQKLTPHSEPIKSILVTKSECHDLEEPCLIVGQQPEMYVVTQFNPIYFLLSFFIPYLQRDSIRMLTMEDLGEKFEESDSLGELIRNKVPLQSQLTKICDTVDENGDTFYRISKNKVVEYLKSKIENIVKDFPSSIASKLINMLTSGIQEDQLKPTDEILRENQIKTSIQLLSSYVDDYYLDLVRKAYSFDELNDYTKKLAKFREMNMIAEENLRSLNENQSKERGRKRSKKEPARKSKKKAVKKVAIGKGALDMFFRHK